MARETLVLVSPPPLPVRIVKSPHSISFKIVVVVLAAACGVIGSLRLAAIFARLIFPAYEPEILPWQAESWLRTADNATDFRHAMSALVRSLRLRPLDSDSWLRLASNQLSPSATSDEIAAGKKALALAFNFAPNADGLTRTRLALSVVQKDDFMLELAIMRDLRKLFSQAKDRNALAADLRATASPHGKELLSEFVRDKVVVPPAAAKPPAKIPSLPDSSRASPLSSKEDAGIAKGVKPKPDAPQPTGAAPN